MTIFLIMLVQALPVYIVARVFKSGTFVTLSAIIMAVLAIANGRSAYTAIDLLGIGAAYCLGQMHIAAGKKADRSLGSEYSASVEAAHRPMTFAETETAVNSPARATSVAFRQQMLGPVNEAIHEQFAVLLAAMHVHLAIEAKIQFGGIANQSKEKQDDFISQQVAKGLEQSDYEPSFLRRKFTRYVFDLYRESYVAVANLLPPSERSLSTVQYRIAATAAEFLKKQFLADGVADICAFLKVTARAVPAEEKRSTATEMAAAKPKTLIFKTNTFAFQYACKYLVNNAEVGRAVVGMVLSYEDKVGYCVKLANADDNSLPFLPVLELLEKGLLKHVAIFAQKLDSVPSLEAGNLVLWVRNPDMPDDLKMGMIVAKLKPEMDSNGIFTMVG